MEERFMYLISIYFDNETEERLNLLIQRVAKVTGNRFMLDNQVPPHITIASVETKHEDELSARIERITKALVQGEIKLVSVGSFSTKVVFVQPVLNEYLHQLSVVLTKELEQMDETILSPYYQSFSWLPHCTVGKQLSREEVQKALIELSAQFVPINAYVTRIGMAKTNPHRDIKIWDLKDGIKERQIK